MIIIQEPFVTVSWNESKQWVFADWHQNAATEIQRAISMKNLKISQQYQSRKLLINTAVVTDETFQKWYTEIWMPAAISAGLKNVAFIVPKDFLTRIRLYTAGLKQPVEALALHIEYFETKAAAEAWLATQ